MSDPVLGYNTVTIIYNIIVYMLLLLLLLLLILLLSQSHRFCGKKHFFSVSTILFINRNSENIGNIILYII